MTRLDHLILKVNDVGASVAFYVDVMGFELAGKDGPFTVLRVSDDLVIQLAPWGTSGGEHLAFAMDRDLFDRIFARIKERGVAYGDSFHRVGNNEGPGAEQGARGVGPTVYIFDPDRHLVEIRTYEGAGAAS